MKRLLILRAEPGPEPCPECEGTGELWTEDGGDTPGIWYVGAGCWEPCPWCHGTGRTLLPIPRETLLRALRGQ